MITTRTTLIDDRFLMVRRLEVEAGLAEVNLFAQHRVYFKVHRMRSEEPTLYRVLDISYQRNGISGEGFHTVKFAGEHGTLIAVVFKQRGHVAIIDPLDLTNHWRGDNFEDGLRFVVNWWDSQR